MPKINKTCKRCDNQFIAYESPGRQERVFCSKECRDADWKGTELVKTRIEVKCLNCGRTMLRYPSHVNENNFCNHSCKASYEMTGNKHRVGKRPSNAFTTEQVSGDNNPKWVDPIHFTCKFCGEKFSLKPWQTRAAGRTNVFCSAKCRGNHRKQNESGNNSPFWVGGIKTYRGKGWRVARLEAIKRDSGTCQKCGRFVGDSIPVHHIIPFRDFETVEEANAIENLICYCQSCHMKIEPRPMRKV